MDEFDFIAQYFRPLTTGFSGSLNLSDDAALLSPPTGHELVITKDALSQGIHFVGSESPELIAGKALRVNLSDLAAMGATPLCYLLALILPRNTSAEWLEKFAAGLKQTQDEFGIALAGGDTTATDGTLSISITAIGSVPIGKALRRNGAKIGDDIYVSGTLGDATTGLKLILSSRNEVRDLYKDFSIATLSRNDTDNFFISRYLTPQPRITLGIALRDIANSAMDISDGLVQDLGHICTASNVGAIIDAEQIPLSCHPALDAGSRDKTNYVNCDSRSPIKSGMTLLEAALTGGDDYELLFTASPEKKMEIEKLKILHKITCIGKITAGKNVEILDKSGNIIKLDQKGYSHF